MPLAVVVFARALGSQNHSQVVDEKFFALIHSFTSLYAQYALKSLYPASYAHNGQEFGAAVSLDSSGTLFVGSPNQLTSGAAEMQSGAVHVLQIHSSPQEATSLPSTAVNSVAPPNKPMGTSCASLLQQVLAACPSSASQFTLAQGYTVSGVYLIKPTAHEGAPFPIYCDMSTQGGGWSMCYTSDGVGDVDMYTDYSYSALRSYGRRYNQCFLM
jgi:hypothetical protein